MSSVTVEEVTQVIEIETPLNQVDVDALKQYIVIEGDTDTQTIEIDNPSMIVVDNVVRETVELQQEVVSIIEVGTQGPAGRDGVGDLNFQQDFSSTTSLTVTHNLNKFPAVTVIDSAGTKIIGDVSYLNNNQIALTFSAAFGGKVICN